MYNCVWYFCTHAYGLSLNGWHSLFCIVIACYYLDDDCETTYETPTFLCFNFKIHIYLCLLVNETKNPQHLDRGRSIPATHGDKTIPDSTEPRLLSFYPPCVAAIDLHQGVVDSYNPHNVISYTGKRHLYTESGPTLFRPVPWSITLYWCAKLFGYLIPRVIT